MSDTLECMGPDPNVRLKTHALSKCYGGLQALDSVSFQLHAGEMLALIGPNGAGKSTCFDVISGLTFPDNGQIWLDGVDVTRLDAVGRWEKGLGRGFQLAAGFLSLRVIEAVMTALAVADPPPKSSLFDVFLRAQGRLPCFGSFSATYKEKAIGLLEQTGLSQRMDQRISALPYGDIKRLDLALALANQPGVLILDEPGAGLPPADRKALVELVRLLARKEGIGVLFSEHDTTLVFDYATRVLVLDRGQLIADGKPEQIMSDPVVRSSYLGQSLKPVYSVAS